MDPRPDNLGRDDEPELAKQEPKTEPEDETVPVEAAFNHPGLREFPYASVRVDPAEPVVDSPLERDSSERVVAVDEFRARELSATRGERTWPRTPDRKPAERILASNPSPIDPMDSEIPLISLDEPKPDRVRVVMLPTAIGVIVGLLLGYAGGYVVGSREARRSPVADNAPPSALQTPGTSGKTAAREFSDTAVSPSPAPPAPSTGPPTVPSPAPARRTGQIVVTSTPSKASVTVNGTWTGRTPLTLEGRPFGKYAIRIVEPGYDVAREDFQLSPAAATKKISVTLRRAKSAGTPASPAAQSAKPAATAPPPPKPNAAATGDIFVDSRPQGARVLIDGKEVGVTPLRMPDQAVGAHTIRLELADHLVWTSTAHVVGGATARVTGSLERIRQ